MDALRVRWSEATDVKAQVEKHQSQILVGVAVVALSPPCASPRRRRQLGEEREGRALGAV